MPTLLADKYMRYHVQAPLSGASPLPFAPHGERLNLRVSLHYSPYPRSSWSRHTLHKARGEHHVPELGSSPSLPNSGLASSVTTSLPWSVTVLSQLKAVPSQPRAPGHALIHKDYTLNIKMC